MLFRSKSSKSIDRELEGRPSNPDMPGNAAISPSDRIGPKFNAPKKVTREKVTVEGGDIGSVDTSNPDVIGPNMGQVNAPTPAAPEPELTGQQMAQNLLSRPTGYKRGGKVKKACSGGKMSSGGKVSRSSASKRADGIATKGHTRGKYL